MGINFVRSGHVSLARTAIYGIGNAGYGWSNTVETSKDAFFLQLGLKKDNSSINPSHNVGARYDGLPVRCLV